MDVVDWDGLPNGGQPLPGSADTVPTTGGTKSGWQPGHGPDSGPVVPLSSEFMMFAPEQGDLRDDRSIAPDEVMAMIAAQEEFRTGRNLEAWLSEITERHDAAKMVSEIDVGSLLDHIVRAR
jgi:hypothetical protein